MRDKERFVLRYALTNKAGKHVESSVTVEGKKRRDEVINLINNVGYKFLSCESMGRA